MRFSSFSDEWTTTILKDSASFYKGTGISKEELSEEGHPCILYGELYTTYKTEKIEDVKSKTSLPAEKLVKSKANDVIIPASGETPIDIATACCIMNDDILLGGDLNIIRIKNHNGVFLSCQLNGKRKLDIAKIAQGASIVHLHNDDLKKLKCYFPKTICEEEKIVAFLSKIDERIETQSKIIEDLNIEKKVISDKIFSQKPIRKELLCSFYNKGKAGGTPKSTNKKYYDGNIPFLSISDMTEQGKYLYRTQRTLTQEGLENSTAWIVPENSLILSMYASVGQVAINKIPLATSQAMFSMTLKDKSTLDFLYYYLSFFRENKLHKYLETGTQSNINADFVKSIEIPYYGESKNKQIVSLLSLMDERIQKEKDILSLYKKQKAYLLSNMFI